MRLFPVVALSVVAVVGAGCGSSAGIMPGDGSAPSMGGAGNKTTGAGGGGTASGTGGVLGTAGGIGHSSGGAVGQATGGATASGGTAGHETGSGGTTAGNGGGSVGSGGHIGQGTGGTANGSGGHGSGGAGHATGGAGAGTGGIAASGGATGSGGPTTGGGAGTAGNPAGSCTAGVPAGGQPADVSTPTTVVGDGTPGSCTFTALSSAVAKAGVITFNCGDDPLTIAVTATLTLSTKKDTVIDGGNKITFDGGHAVQILNYTSANFQATETRVTLQHLTLINAKTPTNQPIPAAPEAACSQGFDDGQGGALFMRDGNLTVIDCTFTGNQAAQVGPDTGGGAIYIEGSKHGAIIVGSTFTGNSGANAGAVGALTAELDIYNSVFTNNMATGHDANGNDATMCSAINNDQNETGSGGNGGAIYGDGNSFNITLCGDTVMNNTAGKNAFGGGLFFTSDNFAGVLSITDTTMAGNTGGHWTSVKSGSVTDVGSAMGVNAKSITVTNSTLQK